MRRAAFGLLLLVGACTGSPPPRRPDAALPPGDLQPLAVGMKWEYVGAMGERHLHRVAAREKVGSFDCFVYEQQSGSDLRKLWLRSDAAGLRHYRSQNAGSKPRDLDDPSVHFTLPAKPGATWEYEDDYGVTSVRYSGSIEAVESIDVPAGRFTCLRVRTAGKADGVTLLEWTSWYAPGVGLVREDAKLDTGAGPDSHSISLKSFTRP